MLPGQRGLHFRLSSEIDPLSCFEVFGKAGMSVCICSNLPEPKIKGIFAFLPGKTNEREGPWSESIGTAAVEKILPRAIWWGLYRKRTSEAVG